jgi:outer membrane protein assembly factor BamB
LKATSIKSGTDYWDIEIGQAACYSILYNKGIIYTTLNGYPQRLIAVNSKNHAVKWSFSPDAAFAGSTITDPVIVDKILYFGLDFDIYSVDAVTGKQNWFFNSGGTVGGAGNRRYKCVFRGAGQIALFDQWKNRTTELEI